MIDGVGVTADDAPLAQQFVAERTEQPVALHRPVAPRADPSRRRRRLLAPFQLTENPQESSPRMTSRTRTMAGP